MSELETHSEVTIWLLEIVTTEDVEKTIHIYAKQCAVCSGDERRQQQHKFFEFIITEKSPQEFESYYDVSLIR
jgi:hypothetical protein